MFGDSEPVPQDDDSDTIEDPIGKGGPESVDPDDNPPSVDDFSKPNTSPGVKE